MSPKLPPHVNEKPHKELMEKLKNMTLEEFEQSLIKVGILNKDGTPSRLYYPELYKKK